MSGRFDVFLSHNSRDKPTIERRAEKLKRAGLEPWLDKWQLVAGERWQAALAQGLLSSDSCAVFVGPNNLGSWEWEELNVALDRAAKEGIFRLIPVLLPGLPDKFDPNVLPPFLKTRTWIDFRGGMEDSRTFQRFINAIKGVAPGPDTPIEPRTAVCPYRGFQVFDEEHAEFFFGRAADIQRLTEKLKATRFLAVIGASGSGKSSVVRAGLVPALRKGELAGSEMWAIQVLRPLEHPLAAMAAHVARLSDREAMHQTLDQLSTDARTLHLISYRILAERPATQRLVWVIDQFEEVFTQCHDEDERKQFLANLLYAASIPDGRSVVILTMRADFYSKCTAYPEFAAHLAAQQYLVSPMDLDGLRDAITEPARQVGLEFEDGLVAIILDDITNQPGALPLLEHALLELWERRRGNLLTLGAYRESGGIQGAIATRADNIYKSLSPEEQEVVRRVMLRLTQPGEGTEDTRRRATLRELGMGRTAPDVVDHVIKELTDARLLTTTTAGDPGEQVVERLT